MKSLPARAVRILTIAVAPVLISTVASCGKGKGPEGGLRSEERRDGGPRDATMTGGASVSFSAALSFAGTSVRICGARSSPADLKYRCASSLSSVDAGTDAGSACPCFVFGPDGGLTDPSTGMPAVIRDLCPSVDVSVDASGPGAWTFTYALFNSMNCSGTQLNDGINLTCFDSRDVAAQQHPNATVEELEPGLNTNQILCVSPEVCTTPPTITTSITTASNCGVSSVYPLFIGTPVVSSPCGPNFPVTITDGRIIGRGPDRNSIVPFSILSGGPLVLVFGTTIRDSFNFAELQTRLNSISNPGIPGIMNGTYRIDWTATDSVGNTSTVSQFVVARPKIQAASTFTLLTSGSTNGTVEDEFVASTAGPGLLPGGWPNVDRANACRVMPNSPTPACCRGLMWTASGSGPTGAGTSLQNFGCSGSITSNRNVVTGSNTRVNPGFTGESIVTRGSFTNGGTNLSGGGVATNRTNIFVPPLPGLDPPTGTSMGNVTVTNTMPTTLAPGVYGTVTVDSRGGLTTLTLQAGKYAFGALNMIPTNPTIARIIADANTRLYVGSFSLNQIVVPFTNGAGAVQPVFLAYTGPPR